MQQTVSSKVIAEIVTKTSNNAGKYTYFYVHFLNAHCFNSLHLL